MLPPRSPVVDSLNVLAQQATTLVFGSLTGTTSLGATFVTLLTSLVFIAGRISWIPMVVSFGFFALSLFITTLLLAPVAKATYRVNEAEGDFRFLHARYGLLLASCRSCVGSQWYGFAMAA